MYILYSTVEPTVCYYHLAIEFFVVQHDLAVYYEEMEIGNSRQAK